MRITHDVFRYAADENVAESGAAVRGNDNQDRRLHSPRCKSGLPANRESTGQNIGLWLLLPLSAFFFVPRPPSPAGARQDRAQCICLRTETRSD